MWNLDEVGGVSAPEGGELSLRAYAKINLSIDVVGRRADGYHFVEMVMQQVDLWDLVRISSLPEGEGEGTRGEIRLTTDRGDLPVDSRNLAFRAAALIGKVYADMRAAEAPPAARIHIAKRIPLAAGLAGGSADAAAVVHGLNRLWGLDLPLPELIELSAPLGADVPFCVMGQAAAENDLGYQGDPIASPCAFAEGIGTSLTPLPPLDAWVVLTKPEASLSTKEIYEKLDRTTIRQRPKTRELIRALEEKNWWGIGGKMANVLEMVSIKEYPSIISIKNHMMEMPGLLKAMMSGSGPTIFGIFTDLKPAEEASAKMKEVCPETFLARTLL